MNDSIDRVPAAHRPRGADLDPQIRRFIQIVGAGFARYPDFAALSAPRQRAIAEEVRAPWAQGGPEMARRLDLAIPGPGGTIRARLHDPSNAPGKPVLVYLHGGGWTLFSIDTHDRVMREYAARADVAVLGVDYALSPEAKFPVALDQVVHVVRWLRSEAARLQLNGDRIAIGGDSAGANLSVAASVSLRDAGDSAMIKAMILNYGAFDSQTSAEAAERYGGEGYMLATDEMRSFWDNYVQAPSDTKNPLVCPLRADLRGLPPAFLAVAECDILAEQSAAMARRLRECGVSVQEVVYEGATHSFLEAVSIAELSDRAFRETSQWLHRTLRR